MSPEQQLRSVSSLHEELFTQKIHQPVVIQKTRAAAKVAGKFYRAFKDEQRAFMLSIEGISHEERRTWYTSILLNRLMLVYFIQKKGLLAGDRDYLAHHLQQRQQSEQKNTFFQFFQHFLRHLFGKEATSAESAAAWEREWCSLPYLNGELLVDYSWEQHCTIQIPDEAFARIFAFLDRWHWHLDAGSEQDETAIDPGILGFLFEQSTRAEGMGTYYTREDVTTYIASHAIISFLCDELTRQGYNLFEEGSPGRTLLRTHPARYMYASTQHGLDMALPPEIAAGLADVSLRALWDHPAPENYAHPTETWREVVERRSRLEVTRAMLVNGAATSIHDLTSRNLDILTFLRDVLLHNQDAALLWLVYTTLTRMTVLDPACGSGAFLFAALDVLKPLYDLCLQRMDALVALVRPDPADPACHLTHFRATLQQAAHYPNTDFFVIKLIIENNICGVDIKREIVEICRLRLFLTLVARCATMGDAAHLPEIGFNIHPGNSLLGFTTFDEACQAIRRDARLTGDPDHTIDHFARMLRATHEDDRASRTLPQHIQATGGQRQQFKAHSAQLHQVNRQLHTYLVRGQDGSRETHLSGPEEKQAGPFHWCISFFRIMQRGGFSVIIGNPPYIEHNKIKKQYCVQDYATLATGNTCAWMIERSVRLLAPGGRSGMIVPMSATCTDGYRSLQRLLLAQNEVQIASFSDQRGKLFAIPHPRLCIIQYQKPVARAVHKPQVYATPYLKLEPRMCVSPFERLYYQNVTDRVRPGVIPRSGSVVEYGIARKLFAQAETLARYTSPSGTYPIYYTRKLSWFVQVTPFQPLLFDGQGNRRAPSELKKLSFARAMYADIAFTTLNSNLFYWLLTTSSDCRNLNKREVAGLPLCMRTMNDGCQSELSRLARELERSLQTHARLKTLHSRTRATPVTVQCFFPVYSKSIIDDIDRILARHYGFTAEELDFLLSYDGKYRGSATHLAGMAELSGELSGESSGELSEELSGELSEDEGDASSLPRGQ